MALKTCYECGKQVSSDARVCPNCGKKNPTVNPQLVKISLAVCFGVVLLAIILIVMASN